MEHHILLISSFFAAIIHVLEEYKYGWVDWANNFISGVTVKHFIIVNALFLSLCFLAVLMSKIYIVFSSSIFSLLLINSLFHIVPTIKQRKYSPGLASAILLFIPLGIFGYVVLLENRLITHHQLIISMFIGVLWMSIPIIFQFIRKTNEKA